MIASIAKAFRRLINRKARRERRRRGDSRSPGTMRVGASYSVWDGEELLEFAIRSIRGEVDYVNVVWQQVSWYGNPCATTLEQQLLELKQAGLVDEIIRFEPDLTLSPNLNETDKRNVGLRAARAAGCTHLLTLDTDEFFDAGEFREALQFVQAHEITHSACNQIVYHDIHVRKSVPEKWFAPFVCRIDRGEEFVCNAFGETPWLIDPSKKIPITANSKPCFLGMVRLHHFAGVRRDLQRKFRNSSACQSPEVVQQFIKQYEDLEGRLAKGLEDGSYVRTENIFKIRL